MEAVILKSKLAVVRLTRYVGMAAEVDIEEDHDDGDGHEDDVHFPNHAPTETQKGE